MMFFSSPLNSKVTTRTAARLTSQALSVFSTADKQLKIYKTKPDLHHELTKSQQVTWDSGRQKKKMSLKTGNAQYGAIVFRHFAVLSLQAVLLRKVSTIKRGQRSVFLITMGWELINERRMRYPEVMVWVVFFPKKNRFLPQENF